MKRLDGISIKDFLKKSSRREGKIGGGSISCLCAAAGVSVLQLVLSFSLKSQAGRRRNILGQLDNIRKDMEKLIDADARAFYKKDDYKSASEVCVEFFGQLKKVCSVLDKQKRVLNQRLFPDIVLVRRLLMLSLENIILNLEENVICMKSKARRRFYKNKLKEIKGFARKFGKVKIEGEIKRRYGQVA